MTLNTLTTPPPKEPPHDYKRHYNYINENLPAMRYTCLTNLFNPPYTKQLQLPTSNIMQPQLMTLNKITNLLLKNSLTTTNAITIISTKTFQ